MSQPEPLYCAASLSLFHSHTHTNTHTLSPTLCPGIASLFPSLSPCCTHIHALPLQHCILSFCLTSAARLISLSSILLPLCVPTLHHLSVVLSLPLFFSYPSALLFNYPQFSSLFSLILSVFHGPTTSPALHSSSPIISANLSIRYTHVTDFHLLSVPHTIQAWVCTLHSSLCLLDAERSSKNSKKICLCLGTFQ